LNHWYYIHRLPRKGPDHQQPVLAFLKRFNDEIKKKRPHLKKKKVLLHQDNAPFHKSIKTTAKCSGQQLINFFFNLSIFISFFFA
jgi:hypothetical protein